jgi:hypothetical protein
MEILQMYRPDIVVLHSITKREADILYMGLRKIHSNIIRFEDIVTADAAIALADRAKTGSA